MSGSAQHAPMTEIGWQLRPLSLEEAPLAYPLLLALDEDAEPLRVWQERVGRWLQSATDEGSRGIATLRNRSGVIHALFFYDLQARPQAIMGIGRLRAIEPADAWHGLRAALQGAELVALDHGCQGILLRAEPHSSAWAHTSRGMARLGQALGYEPRGGDWFAPLAAAAHASAQLA